MEANDDYIWLTAAAQSEATSAVGGGDVAVLAATVAHDLGSVLGSIRAVAQATRSEQDPAERDIDIETILDASFGGELVDALRDLVTPALHHASTSVGPCVGRAAQLAFRVARQKSRSMAEPVVAPVDPSLHLEGSQTTLTRVVFNLVLNALEAGGPVQLTVASEAGELLIDVVDGGCGIAAERLATIADPFVTGKQEGRGLAVVVQGVAALGGRLGVRSTIGQGTTFRVLLPLSRGDTL